MVRRNWIKAMAFGLIAAVSGVGAQADPISDLYSTGVDASHNVLPGNGVNQDTHYSLIGPSGGVPAYAVNPYPGAWYDPSSLTPAAKWISPANGTANGTYTYTTTFTLPSTAILGSVSITGQATADDMINTNPLNPGASLSAIKLNGVAISPAFFTPDETYGHIYNFTINASGGNAFLTGSNTLEFVTKNTHGVVTGLLVSMSGSYNSAVPEPASMAMLGLGVAGLAAASRFRGRRAG